MNDGQKTGRFLLFGSDHYYAKGGFHDFVSSHDDVTQAVAEAEKLMASEAIEWWHLYDRLTSTVIKASEQQAYGMYGFTSAKMPMSIA